ncbi:hypothetical protein RIF29_14469 [Crotalaria pallida]|uniref:Uncharacterized protein n=1 Tax=Crotalaria pallida TaxID=3830 RepID=A0AAN9FH44_CROPI
MEVDYKAPIEELHQFFEFSYQGSGHLYSVNFLEVHNGNNGALHPYSLASQGQSFMFTLHRRFFEKVQWKNFSHACTAPLESKEDLSIVTGAQLQVENYGLENILFLRLRFSTMSGAKLVKYPDEWIPKQACLLSQLKVDECRTLS